jgi:hypothetical protein
MSAGLSGARSRAGKHGFRGQKIQAARSGEHAGSNDRRAADIAPSSKNAQAGIILCTFQCFHTADKFIPVRQILPLCPRLFSLIEAVAMGFFNDSLSSGSLSHCTDLPKEPHK